MGPNSTPASQRANKAPASQRAYEHTKSMLLDGAAQPGQMLSEGDVAQSLGISRTPVREAFTRLQSEGWLRLYPRRGALVVTPDPNEAQDLLDARMLLESAALDRITADTDASDRLAALVATLGSVLDDQQAALEADDLVAFTERDLDFHRGIIEAAGNSVFLRFHDLVADQERRMSVRSLWRAPTAAARVVRQHRELLTAVGQGNTEQFRSLLREHLHSIHADRLP